MYFVLTASTLLIAAQTTPTADLPYGFEPPLAEYSSGTANAPCMGSALRLVWNTKANNTHVTMLSFGKKLASNQELDYINKIISPLKGQIYPQISCESTGSLITFRDANPNSREKVRFVHIIVTSKIIEKLEM